MPTRPTERPSVLPAAPPPPPPTNLREKKKRLGSFAVINGLRSVETTKGGDLYKPEASLFFLVVVVDLFFPEAVSVSVFVVVGR